jgi:hypothetical protein
VDQYLQAEIVRPEHDGMLVPGFSLDTPWHPDFDALPVPGIKPPATRRGVIGQGKGSATMKGSHSTLIEVVEGWGLSVAFKPC